MFGAAVVKSEASAASGVGGEAVQCGARGHEAEAAEPSYAHLR